MLTAEQLDELNALWQAVEAAQTHVGDLQAVLAELQALQRQAPDEVASATQDASRDRLLEAFQDRVTIAADVVAAEAAVVRAQAQAADVRYAYFTAAAKMIKPNVELIRQQIAGLERELGELHRLAGSWSSNAVTARQAAGRHRRELAELAATAAGETATIVAARQR